MVGITNITGNISIENITKIADTTTLPGFFVRVNHIVFLDWGFFILMCALFIIFYFAGQQLSNQPMKNLMYSGALLTIICFFARAMTETIDGEVYPLITDYQLWIFPLITIAIAMIIWSTKE